MSEKPPRPPWLRVIEGDKKENAMAGDRETNPTPVSPSNIVEVSFGHKNSEQESVSVTPEMLVNQWMKVTERPPVNWAESTKPELIAKSRTAVQKYTVAQLYMALGSETLWSRPSFARALMDEVRERMIRNTFEPLTE